MKMAAAIKIKIIGIRIIQTLYLSQKEGSTVGGGNCFGGAILAGAGPVSG